MRGGEIDARIELDLSIRRQSEGGVALDTAGQAFGMTVFGPRRRVLVIPGATIARVAAQLETHGKVPRGYLGLGLSPSGSIVTTRWRDGDERRRRGPWRQGGGRQGDIIAAWDGKPSVSSRDAPQPRTRERRQHHRLVASPWRRQRTVDLVIGERL